jgi:hypothetical protein
MWLVGALVDGTVGARVGAGTDGAFVGSVVGLPPCSPRMFVGDAVGSDVGALVSVGEDVRSHS